MKAPESIVLAALIFGSGCDIANRQPLGEAGGPVVNGPDAAPGAGVDGGATTDGPACWHSPGSPLGHTPPPPLSALNPLSGVLQACAIATNPATAWTYPKTTFASDADDRARITGRWITCGASDFLGGSSVGIEFGGNGRWTLLDSDVNGDLVPACCSDKRGYYYLFASGQLNLTGDGPASWGRTYVIQLAAGADALLFPGTSTTGPATYARTWPSPLNGEDNVPTVSDGRCSLVGTWDVPANTGTPPAPAAWISFDGIGNFEGAPIDSDCSGYTMYGTYQLSPGWFQITTNVGMGSCRWWNTAGYEAVFDDGCTQLTLTQDLDNCTGGRGYLNGMTTLTRRP